jgi:hypothetical protein
MGSWTIIAARSADDAIVQIAGCARPDVEGCSSRPRVGTERYSLFRGDVWEHWDIEDMRFVPIIARLALYAGFPQDDIFKTATVRDAVEAVVEATGMLYAQAELQVRIWLSTLDSPHYNAIGLHTD